MRAPRLLRARPPGPRLRAPSRQRARVLLLTPHRQMRRVQALTTQHRRDLTRPGRPGRFAQDPQLVRGGEPPTLRPLSELRVAGPLPATARAPAFRCARLRLLHEKPRQTSLHLHTLHGLQHHNSSVLTSRLSNQQKDLSHLTLAERGELAQDAAAEPHNRLPAPVTRQLADPATSAAPVLRVAAMARLCGASGVCEAPSHPKNETTNNQHHNPRNRVPVDVAPASSPTCHECRPGKDRAPDVTPDDYDHSMSLTIAAYRLQPRGAARQRRPTETLRQLSAINKGGGRRLSRRAPYSRVSLRLIREGGRCTREHEGRSRPPGPRETRNSPEPVRPERRVVAIEA